MDFELSDDQVALRDGVHSLLEGKFALEAVRALEETSGVDRSMWTALADAGVFALTTSEDDGGVGLGWADAALVYEQLGLFLVPGPVIGSLAASSVVEGVASGDRVAGLVAPSDGDVYIENFDGLDVVVALTDDGVFEIDPAEMSVESVAKPLDPLTSIHKVLSMPAGRQVGDAADAVQIRQAASLLISAMLLGSAVATLDLAVAYAKERKQFGKPIGSFQAVKHICADMATRVETARSAVYAAGVMMDVPETGDADRALSAAKIIASEAAVDNGRGCIQVHGGMGYTWEVPAHLYLKRAWVLESAFGDPDHHAELMAAAL